MLLAANNTGWAPRRINGPTIYLLDGSGALLSALFDRAVPVAAWAVVYYHRLAHDVSSPVGSSVAPVF